MKKALLLPIILLQLLVPTATFAQSPGERKSRFHANKENTELIILFAKNLKSEEFTEDYRELYSDWHYYLGEFIQYHPSPRVVTLDYSELKHFTEKSKLAEKACSELSSIFIKKGKKALFFCDPILDKISYEFIDAYFADIEGELMISDLTGYATKADKPATAKFVGATYLSIDWIWSSGKGPQ